MIQIFGLINMWQEYILGIFDFIEDIKHNYNDYYWIWRYIT